MIAVETKAAKLYADAAVTFADDDKFACFLSKLANEEQDHIKLLEESMAFLSHESIDKVTFHFDEDFRHKILAPIVKAQHSLNRGELSQREMVDVIAEIEFSEWNEVFVYAIDATKVLLLLKLINTEYTFKNTFLLCLMVRVSSKKLED
jgi:rubrerythrin